MVIGIIDIVEAYYANLFMDLIRLIEYTNTCKNLLVANFEEIFHPLFFQSSYLSISICYCFHIAISLSGIDFAASFPCRFVIAVIFFCNRYSSRNLMI